MTIAVTMKFATTIANAQTIVVTTTKKTILILLNVTDATDEVYADYLYSDHSSV